MLICKTSLVVEVVEILSPANHVEFIGLRLSLVPGVIMVVIG